MKSCPHCGYIDLDKYPVVFQICKAFMRQPILNSLEVSSRISASANAISHALQVMYKAGLLHRQALSHPTGGIIYNYMRTKSLVMHMQKYPEQISA